VIPGWDQGIAMLNKGSKAVLLIPSPLAYGTRSAGADIPANAVLRFEVELVDFQ
jgi:FKBP-type peptidyl-prolyl cis-trans isomerase